MGDKDLRAFHKEFNVCWVDSYELFEVANREIKFLLLHKDKRQIVMRIFVIRVKFESQNIWPDRRLQLSHLDIHVAEVRQGWIMQNVDVNDLQEMQLCLPPHRFEDVLVA